MKTNTQELAKKTADELLHEGIRPTQQNVRARMGCGSITTINKALNTWWAELGQRLKANNQHPMIPDPIADSASKLWIQALAYAEKSLESRRNELELEYQKLKRESTNSQHEDHIELKELRGQCLRLFREIENTRSQKLDLQHKLAESENRVLRLQSENDGSKRQIKQLEALGSHINLEEHIELKVSARSLKEENKQLKKQLDSLINEKSALMLEIARLEQENQVS